MPAIKDGKKYIVKVKITPLAQLILAADTSVDNNGHENKALFVHSFGKDNNDS